MDNENDCKNAPKPYRYKYYNTYYPTIYNPMRLRDLIFNRPLTQHHDKPVKSKFIRQVQYDKKLNHKLYGYGETVRNNTLTYLFNINNGGATYIEIKGGEIVYVQNLFNDNYVNRFSNKLVQGFNGLAYQQRKNLALYNKPFNNHVFPVRDAQHWTSNGNLINMIDYREVPQSYISAILDMLQYTLKRHKVHDVAFIFWNKDHLILRKDLREPHFYILDQPIPADLTYDKYLPILSQSSHVDFMEVPIPTAEDWAYLTEKFYTPDCNTTTLQNILQIPWADKLPIGFFRGSSTGEHNDRRNPRINITYLSQEHPDLLDAGITQFVRRDKFVNGNIVFANGRADHPNLTLKGRIPMHEQSKYKYVIYIQGNTAAYRFMYMFFLQSVIFRVSTPYYLWFERMLVPYVHYIPVKADLSDLIDKLNWARANDDKCKTIAENSYKFARTYFTCDKMAEYMAYLLNKIAYIPS